MKKRLSLFSFTFLVFYVLVIIARQLPGLVRGRFSFAGGSHSIAEWVQFAGDILIYYLVALGVYLLLCWFHPRKQYPQLFFGLLVICMGAYFCCLFWARAFADAPVRMSRYFQLVIIPITAQVFFAIIFYLVRYSQYKELQQVELQLQNRQTELSFLRSQINPHFLFNHLNNIYALVYEQNAQALPAISGLSELLRYMLYNSNEVVLLSTEISYIEKYIALQQLRFEYPSMIAVTKSCRDKTAHIPPLLLIPFIENAFKHGEVSIKENWLKMEIDSNSDQLNFSCANIIGTHKKDITGGIGLKNVKQRLNLLYPGLHRLEITEVDNLFVVKLQLYYGK
ncbi:sensor histidine kinase [Mucilaginibacter aquariorum]|uniref:Sensor histidine kinase n=1 Tax=Mucilaginibacter aquariorum TaxID=2967225 RepID=A0ABT1SVH4_9SPHI|nr:sensor histidine kinase [Mucilaginibacter aquariorum]MCQ6956340.1 sensor histidine kinase [Mucilaginibacter aquariorum]